MPAHTLSQTVEEEEHTTQTENWSQSTWTFTHISTDPLSDRNESKGIWVNFNVMALIHTLVFACEETLRFAKNFEIVSVYLDAELACGTRCNSGFTFNIILIAW